MCRWLVLFCSALVVAVFAPPAVAGPIVFTASLPNAPEVPPNASTGTGFTILEYDPALHTLRVRITFSGLTGTTTASHVHTPTTTPFTGTAGVATAVPSFPNFPLGVTAGSYDQTFDLTLASSYNPAFLNNATNMGSTANAEASLISGLGQGRAYLNIHTSFAGGGEIRGFLVQDVPEPASVVLLGAGVVALVGYRRRFRPAA